MRMPLFEFKCDCGLVFEEIVRDETAQTHECPDCGRTAEKEISDFGFKFEGKGDGNPEKDTGVDSVDNNIDRIIGRDADHRWEHIKDRQSRKRRVQRKEDGVDSTPLRKNPETGEYEPMTDGQVDFVQQMHGYYSRLYQEHDEERREKGIPRFEDEGGENWREQAADGQSE